MRITRITMTTVPTRCIAHADHAHHHDDGAHPVQVVGLGLLDLGVALCGDAQQAVTGERVLHGGDRPLTRHEDGKHHVGKNHHLSHREYGQLFGQCEIGGVRVHVRVFDTARSGLEPAMLRIPRRIPGRAPPDVGRGGAQSS
jgi:hypothetical protein